MDYLDKYHKYKKKYIVLKKLSKKQIGGESTLKEGDEITGTINKIFYCGFSLKVKVDDKEKVIYVQKYPPASGTLVPDMSNESTQEEKEEDKVSKEELINFWESEEIYQPNGNWKGGRWGSNNLITTSENWVSGGFIGDEIKLTVKEKGILPFAGGKVFKSDASIIPGSENKALSCTIDYKNQTYACYITDNVMPQVANDVLFIYKNINNERFIKLLKRGEGPNVDMPRKMMPGAGEHLEPGADIKLKDGVLRAINEEIGISDETLAQSYLLNIGVYDSEGRDPRYWTYCIKRDNGELVNFGTKRGSSSQGYIVYFESSSDKAPKETNPLDTEEINKKWWNSLNDTLLIDNDKWMIIDHKKLVINAIIELEKFNCKEDNDKNQYLMNNN